MDFPTEVNISNHITMNYCFSFSLSNYILLFYTLGYAFLIPLFTYIFFIGYQSWKTSKSCSHSDILAYNATALELLCLLSLTFYCVGAFVNEKLFIFGMNCFNAFSCGQTLLHVLNCMERYFAVVHPITYMKRKQKSGAKICYVSITYVWISCFVSSGVMHVIKLSNLNMIFYVIFSACLFNVCYCSVAVLRVLVTQSPGNKIKSKIDPSKKRAFTTILLILGALVLRFVGILVRGQFISVCNFINCLVSALVIWLNLPSSLVLPLLFLQRAGKLPGLKRNTQEK